MAIIDKETLFNAENLNGAKWSFGVPLERTNPVPIDKWSIFETYAEAVAFVNRKTGNIAYPGQIIAIETDTQVDVYVVDRNATDCLRKLATGGDASEIERQLNAEISNRISADAYLSSEISTIQTTTLPTLSTTLKENLSIDVAVEAGTGDILSSYVISQGGVAKTVKIDIPKDKVIEKASVVKFNTDAEAQAATGDPDAKAGTYLKLEIQNQTTALYVPVPALASVYTGHDGDTVKVDVVNDPAGGESYTISAIVKTGSIGAEHLTTELSTAIHDVISSDADVRSTVATLSGDGEGSFKYADQQLSNALTVVISGISSTLSDDLEAEITRATNAENGISTAVDNKITVDGLSVSQLHVQHISQDDYHQLVVDGNVDPNTVYVVSSDSLNMYDEKIINLAPGTDQKDAVNVGQLCAISSELNTKIEEAVESGVQELSTKIYGTNGLKDTLSNAITAEVDRASKAEQYLSGQISAVSATTLISANAYTDTVSTALSTDYVAKIKDVSDSLSDYVLKSVAEEATSTDKLVKETTVDSKIATAISALDVPKFEVAAGESISSIEEIDGKIVVGKQAIQISEDQVTNLTTDLNNRVLTADLETWKNETGLSAAGEGADNQVVLWKDVKDITTAMHFRGAVTPVGEESDEEAIKKAITNLKSGDLVIITTNSKEYVYDGLKWVELGDEKLYETKADAAQKLADANNYTDTKISALDYTDTAVNHQFVTKVDEVDGKISVTRAALVSEDIPDLSERYDVQGAAASALTAANKHTDDEISRLTDTLSAISSDLSDALSVEIKNRTSADTVLSTAIDQKIWIKDPASADDEYKTGKYSDLSVIKVTAAEYAQKVKDGTNLDSNILYIVSSDYIDAYGQQMKNLAEPTDLSDAATKNYVDSKVGTAVQDVTVNGKTVVDAADHIAKINLSAMAFKDKVAISDLDTALSAEISAKAKQTDLQLSVNNISARINPIEANYISAVEINGVTAEVTDHTAKFETIIWDCGTSI